MAKHLGLDLTNWRPLKPVITGLVPRAWTKIAVTCAGSLLLSSAPALAACPNDVPGDPVCDPYVSVLVPTAAFAGYFPAKADGPYFGGGVEMAFLSWSSNNNAYGPSHGKFYGSASLLTSLSESRRALLYRFGGVVSFEGNASRRFLIPHFGAAIGGVWETHLKNNTILDGSLGVYIVHTRSFILDAEGGMVFPFSSVDELFGPRVQLAASFALW